MKRIHVAVVAAASLTVVCWFSKAHAATLTSGAGSCQIRAADGAVACWGEDGFGALGDGNTLNVDQPVLVQNLRGVSSIASGASFSCALIGGTGSPFTPGTVWCWGSNPNGQIGNGTFQDQLVPVQVVGTGSDVVSIAAGLRHACALHANGTIQCWGDDSSGELGDGNSGSAAKSAVPVSVLQITNATSIAAGGDFTCALLTGGSVRCWGSNGTGVLGISPSVLASAPSPVLVQNLTNVSSITAGLSHACAILANGAAVTCWGDNQDGEVGNGTASQFVLPGSTVAGLTGVQSVAAGFERTCALLGSGAVDCWGENSFGEFGNGTSASVTTTPVQSFTGLSGNVAAIATGITYEDVFVLLTNGDVYAAGFGEGGNLGNGAVNDSTVPVLRAPIPSVQSVPVPAFVSYAFALAAVGLGLVRIRRMSPRS